MWLSVKRTLRVNRTRLILGFLFAYWLYNRLRRTKKSVRGHVVIITGAGSGLGRLFCERFARLGAKLVILDVNEVGLKETESLVRALDADCVVMRFVCDITSRDDIVRVVDEVRRELGPIDILINNAGVVAGKHLEKLTEKDIKRTMDVNLVAPIILSGVVLPDMLARGSGHIVNVCSAGGIIGVGKLTDYCASKAGLRLFSEALSEELRGRTDFPGSHRIKVTALSPYFISTGMFNGVSQIPFLLPLLTPEYVVDKAMKGILLDQTEVCIPFMVSISPALSAILPQCLREGMADWLQVTRSMENFKTREEMLQLSKKKTCDRFSLEQ